MLVPDALMLRSADDLPWATVSDGARIRVPHVDIGADLFVLNSRLAPGYRSGRHRHSGHVFVLTLAGAWKYDEHDDVMRPGSYLYEPAGSVHTLQVLDDNAGETEFWAIVYGALEYVDPNGALVGRLDATGARALYLEACKTSGLPSPNIAGPDGEIPVPLKASAAA